MRFIVQAVNGVGLVTLDANMGAYYVPGRMDQPTEPTTHRVGGARLDRTLWLSDHGERRADGRRRAVAGLPVTFRLGPQSRLGFTDANGRATATLSLLGIPGPNELPGIFAGTSLYVASSATAPFDIERQPTVLTLDLSAGDPLVTATLTDGTGRRMGEKTIFFVITGAGGSYAATEITDYAGTASLPGAPLAAGRLHRDRVLQRRGPVAFGHPGVDGRTLRTFDGERVASRFVANGAPSCDAAYAVPGYLWPPDKQFHAITVMGVTDPDGDPVTITITGIRQDEPVGRGNLSPDGQGVGTSTAEVRSERSGKGDGRVYHIYFTATDDRRRSVQR